MRGRFDEQLESLGQEMIEMGAMIENAIDAAGEVLEKRDIQRAREIMDGDREIDRKERDIEALCLRMLLTQQPVAKDLRVVSSAIKMITDMERIGDHAADISEVVTMLRGSLPEQQPKHILQMAQSATRMVHSSIDAYVKRDAELARRVMNDDDIVDDLFLAVKSELIGIISSDPQSGGLALDLLMIAKYFERIGDHAVNIAEWVEFAVTGIYKGEKL
ncbi:MAG: phosphate signaling complex protein PhoU [Eubacteriales bacterium]|nr:phosphate signaling complex protein PhoU [Eubacteriales bacterium]MDD3882984.1 phosphate signaling complex protein PhoU [Eubacteriales bacterium]MDD4513468.1 phosphate signaling complex protein PhoU [Eubacteriales bacterium]